MLSPLVMFWQTILQRQVTCDPISLSKITTLIVGIICGTSSSAYSVCSIYKRTQGEEANSTELTLHHCNMQNHTHVCRFKTLTFKLEQWKHFEYDLLQNYQLSHSSTASLIWWHMWVTMCVTPFPLTSLMSLFPTMVLNSLRSLIIPLRISAMRFLWWLLTSWIRDSSTSKATRCFCVHWAYEKKLEVKNDQKERKDR